VAAGRFAAGDSAGQIARELRVTPGSARRWRRAWQQGGKGCASAGCRPTHPSSTPAEGIWSLLKRAMANFAAPGLDHLVRIVKRKLKKIQYRPHLITGCLTATGLTIEAS
jgi:hypothetical protein